jgi:DNA-binding transcriptional MocR family regulator
MTPAEEARFITLWQQGASYRALAQALGCALGTVGSRAAALEAQGKLQTRPRGGAYPRQQALAARTGRAGRRAEPSAVQVHDGAELPIPAAVEAELTRLWAAIEALRQDLHRPVHDTVQSLPEPLFDDPTDNATERWNLYLKHGLRVRVEALVRGPLAWYD